MKVFEKTFVKLAAVFGACGFLMLTGCANSISSGSGEAVEYGSIEVVSGESVASDSRALDVSSLTTATVTVSGYGMQDVSKKDVAITAGAGTVAISGIPAGNNRVVTVESNVTGAVIRAVCTVEAGKSTSVAVDWDSTAVASVFYYLIKSGIDVSSIESSSFSSKIPAVHPSLFDAKAFATAFKAGGNSASGMASDTYVSTYGTVSVTSSNAAGYTVQVTDVASESQTISGASDSFELKAYPGSWKVLVKDSAGATVKSESVYVASGETTTVDVSLVSAGVDFSDKVIVFIKAA